MAAWKLKWMSTNKGIFLWWIRVTTKLLNSKQSSKGTLGANYPIGTKLKYNKKWQRPLPGQIQFASGAKPGVKRKISKTKTEVETKEKRKKYEKDKRPARTFNIKWKEGRDWLVFDISSCLTLFSDNQGFILCMAHG
jgi:hypothetical protein